PAVVAPVGRADAVACGSACADPAGTVLQGGQLIAGRGSGCRLVDTVALPAGRALFAYGRVMKALVTGATGFVGSAVARALLQAGWQVTALVRPNADLRNLRGLGADLAAGDLADRASLERALDGCAALFHVAADYRLGARNPEELYRTNVEGTRNIMEASRRAGTGRVVYTSSVATIGLPADGTPGTEETPSTVADMIG